MFFIALGLNQHTIDELVQIFHKVRVHQIHIVGQCISQSKRHHCTHVQTIP
jgi:hypothetical protein